MVNTSSSAGKNLWIAASDGDFERVKFLIEEQGMSPNAADENTYTPMHAAASYAHLPLLEYLISKGGNINITDEDGDTPLFVVESVETARWLVEHGAQADVKNGEGLTAAEYLFEEHPETAVFLQSLINSSNPLPLPAMTTSTTTSYQSEQLTSQLTESLLAQTNQIMQDAERDGTDPEERLREVVGRAVEDGMRMGRQEEAQAQAQETDEGPTSKRAREE